LGKTESQVLAKQGVTRVQQSEFSFGANKSKIHVPAETQGIGRLRSFLERVNLNGEPPLVSGAGVDPNVPKEIEQKLAHFKITTGDIDAAALGQYEGITDGNNSPVEAPTKVAVQTTAMYGNYQFHGTWGIVGGALSFKRDSSGITDLGRGAYTQGYMDTSIHIEDPRYLRMVDDWSKDKYATRGVFRSEDYSKEGQEKLEGVKLLRNVSIHEEAIRETAAYIEALSPRSATAERLSEGKQITNKDLENIRKEYAEDLEVIQSDMQAAGAMYYMSGPAMGYNETNLSDNTVAGIRRQQVKQTLDQIETLKQLGIKPVIHTDINRMDIDTGSKRRLLEEAYVVQTHTFFGMSQQQAHHNVSGLVIPNLDIDSQAGSRLKEAGLASESGLAGFISLGTARLIGSFAYEMGIQVDLDAAPDSYVDAIMGSIGRTLNVGAVYRQRKDAAYQGPSGADLSSFYKPTYRDVRSGNFQEIGLLPVMPNEMPDDFFEYYGGLSTRIYSDRYQALYGTKATGMQGHVLERLDAKLSAPGFGMGLNQLFRQDDLYTPGQGLAGFLATSIGRVFDTVSGHYTMQRIKKQHDGDLSGSLGEYQQKIIEQEHFRAIEQRGFFENLFNTLTTTIADTSLSMASYFGVTHAYSIAKAQIEDAGSKHILDVVTGAVGEGKAHTSILMLTGGHSKLFEEANQLHELMDKVGGFDSIKSASSLGDYLLAVQDFTSGQDVTIAEGATDSVFGWYKKKKDVEGFMRTPTGPGAAPVSALGEQQLFDFLDDIYNVKPGLDDDLASLVKKKLGQANTNSIDPAALRKAYAKALEEMGITINLPTSGNAHVSGSVELARSLDNANSGAIHMPDAVGFRNIRAVRRLDSANLTNMFLPFLDNAVDLSTEASKEGYLKAREQLVDLARAKPVLTFDSSVQGEHTNKILHYGYDRLTDLARTFDDLAQYLPAYPLLWIKPIRDAFNRYELAQGKTKDDILGTRRSFRDLIGPGFTGLLSLQGEVSRTIGSIAQVGVGKYVTNTLEVFKLQGQASVLEAKIANSFKESYKFIAQVHGAANNVNFDDVLQAFIDRLQDPKKSGINQQDFEELAKLHSEISLKINKTPGLKYSTGHNELGAPGEDSYAGLRKFLFSAGAVLIADRIIDHFFIKPQGVDLGDSLMSHIFGTVSPEVEGREEDAKVLAGYSQNYSHTAPAIFKYPAATAGYAIGGLVFPSVYHQASHLKYWTSATKGKQFTSDQVELVTQVASGITQGLQGITPNATKEQLAEAFAKGSANAFAGSNKLRFGYAGAFVGASLALLATQAITSVVASTLEPLVALGDTAFRGRWHDPRKGLELDPIKGSAAAIFAKAHRQGAARAAALSQRAEARGGKAGDYMDYTSRGSMVVAWLLSSSMTVSAQQPGRLFYPFATQIAAPFYQFAMVGKLDPSSNQITMQSGLQLFPLSGVGFMVPSMFNPATKYTPSIAEQFLINQLTDLTPGMNQRALIGDDSDVEQRKEAYSLLKASSGILSLALGSGLNPTFDYRPVMFIGGLTALQSAEQVLGKSVGRLKPDSALYKELKNYETVYSIASMGLNVTDKLTRGAFSLSLTGVNYLTHSITAFLGRGELSLFKAGPAARKLMPFYLSAMLVAGMLRPGQTTTEHQSDHIGSLIENLTEGNTFGAVRLEQDHLTNYVLATAIGSAGFGGALTASGAFENVADWANEAGTGYIGLKKQEMYKTYLEHLGKIGVSVDDAADFRKQLMVSIKRGENVTTLLSQVNRQQLPLLQSGAARLGMASRVLAPILLGSFVAAQFLSLTDFYDHSNPVSYLLRGLTDTGRGAQMTYEQKAMLSNLGIKGARYQPKNVGEAVSNVGDYLLRSVFFMGNPSKSMGTYQDAPSPFLGLGGPFGVSGQQDMMKSYMQSQSVAADVSGSFYLMPAMASEFNNAKSLGPLLAAAQRNPNLTDSRAVALYRATLMRKSRATYKNNISAGESAAISSPTLQIAIGRRSDEVRRLAWQTGEGHMLDLLTTMAAAGRIKTEATTNFISNAGATIYDFVGNNFRIQPTNIAGNPVRFSIQTNAEFARAMWTMAKGSNTQTDINTMLYDSERVQDAGPNPVTGYFGNIMSYAFGTFYDRTLDEYGPSFHNILPAAALAFSAVGLSAMLTGTAITSVVQGIGALGALQVYGTLADSARNLDQARQNVTHVIQSTSYGIGRDNKLMKQVGSVMSEMDMTGGVTEEAITALNSVFGKRNQVGSLGKFSNSLAGKASQLASMSASNTNDITEVLRQIKADFNDSVEGLQKGFNMSNDAFKEMLEGIFDATDSTLVAGINNILRNMPLEETRRQEIEILLLQHMQNNMDPLRNTSGFKLTDAAPSDKSRIVYNSLSDKKTMSASSAFINTVLDQEGYSGLFKRSTGGLFRASFAMFDMKAAYEFASFAAASSDPMDELERRRSSYAAAASLFQTFGMIIPGQVVLGTLAKNPTLAVAAMVAAVGIGSVAYANKGFRKKVSNFFKPKFKWADRNIIKPTIRSIASALDAVGSIGAVQTMLSPVRVITSGLDPMFTNMRRRAARIPGVNFIADMFIPETKESFYDRWSEQTPTMTAYGPRMELYTRAEIEQDRKNRIESRRRRGGQLNAGISVELMSGFLQGRPDSTELGRMRLERLTKGAGRVASEHIGYSYVSPLIHLAVKRRQQEIDSYGNALLGPLVPETRGSAAPILSLSTSVMRYSLHSTGSLIQAPMDVAGKGAAITIKSFAWLNDAFTKVKDSKLVFGLIGGAKAAPNNQMFTWAAAGVIGSSILADRLGWTQKEDKKWQTAGLVIGAGATAAVARPYAGAAFNMLADQDNFAGKNIRKLRRINMNAITDLAVKVGMGGLKWTKGLFSHASQWARTQSWSRIAANTGYSGAAIVGATMLLSPAVDDFLGWGEDPKKENDRKLLDRRRMTAIGVTAGVSLLARLGATWKPNLAGSAVNKVGGSVTRLATFGVSTLAVFKLSKVVMANQITGFGFNTAFNVGYGLLNLEDDAQGRAKAQAYEATTSTIAFGLTVGYAYNVYGKELINKARGIAPTHVGWAAFRHNVKSGLKNIFTPVTFGAPYWGQIRGLLGGGWNAVYNSNNLAGRALRPTGRYLGMAKDMLPKLPPGWNEPVNKFFGRKINWLINAQNAANPTKAQYAAFDAEQIGLREPARKLAIKKWGTVASHAAKLTPLIMDTATIAAAHHRYTKVDPKDHLGNYKEAYRAYYQSSAMTAVSSVLSAISGGDKKVGLVSTLLTTTQVSDIAGRMAEEWATKDLYSGRLLTEQRAGQDSYFSPESAAGVGALTLSAAATASYYKVGVFKSARWDKTANFMATHAGQVAQTAITAYNWQDTWRAGRQRYSGTNPNYIAAQRSSDLGKGALYAAAMLSLASKNPSSGGKNLALRTAGVVTFTAAAMAMDNTESYFAKQHTLAVREAGIRDVYVKNLIQREAAESTLGYGAAGAAIAGLTVASLLAFKGKGTPFWSKASYALLSAATGGSAASFFGHQWQLNKGIQKYKDGITPEQYLERQRWIDNGAYTPDSWRNTDQNRMQWLLWNTDSVNARNQVRRGRTGAAIGLGNLSSSYVTPDMIAAAQDRELRARYGQPITFTSTVQFVGGATILAANTFRYEKGLGAVGVTFRQHIKPTATLFDTVAGSAKDMSLWQKGKSIGGSTLNAGFQALPLMSYYFAAQGAKEQITKHSGRYSSGRMTTAQYLQATALSRRAYMARSEALYDAYLPGSSSIMRSIISGVAFGAAKGALSGVLDSKAIDDERRWIERNKEGLNLSSLNLAKANRASRKYLTGGSGTDKVVGLATGVTTLSINLSAGFITGGPVGIFTGLITSIVPGLQNQAIAKANISRHRARNVLLEKGNEVGHEGILDDLSGIGADGYGMMALNMGISSGASYLVKRIREYHKTKKAKEALESKRPGASPDVINNTSDDGDVGRGGGTDDAGGDGVLSPRPGGGGDGGSVGPAPTLKDADDRASTRAVLDTSNTSMSTEEVKAVMSRGNVSVEQYEGKSKSLQEYHSEKIEIYDKKINALNTERSALSAEIDGLITERLRLDDAYQNSSVTGGKEVYEAIEASHNASLKQLDDKLKQVDQRIVEIDRTINAHSKGRVASQTIISELGTAYTIRHQQFNMPAPAPDLVITPQPSPTVVGPQPTLEPPVSRGGTTVAQPVMRGRNAIVTDLGDGTVRKTLVPDGPNPQIANNIQVEAAIQRKMAIFGVSPDVRSVNVDSFVMRKVTGHAVSPLTGEALTASRLIAARKLALLHSLGVVHGDVHSGNILTSPDGTKATVLDYGYSRLASVEEAYSMLSDNVTVDRLKNNEFTSRPMADGSLGPRTVGSDLSGLINMSGSDSEEVLKVYKSEMDRHRRMPDSDNVFKLNELGLPPEIEAQVKWTNSSEITLNNGNLASRGADIVEPIIAQPQQSTQASRPITSAQEIINRSGGGSSVPTTPQPSIESHVKLGSGSTSSAPNPVISQPELLDTDNKVVGAPVEPDQIVAKGGANMVSPMPSQNLGTTTNPLPNVSNYDNNVVSNPLDQTPSGLNKQQPGGYINLGSDSIRPNDPVTIISRSGRGLVGNAIDSVKEADWQTRGTYASNTVSAGMATFNLYRGVTTLAKKNTTGFEKSYGFEYLSQSGAGYATTYLTIKGGLKATKALPYLNYASDAISLAYGSHRLNTATTEAEYIKAKGDVGGAIGGLAGNVAGQGIGWLVGGAIGAGIGAVIGFFGGFGIGAGVGAAAGFKIGSSIGSIVGSIAGSMYGEQVGRDWVTKNKYGAGDAVEVFDLTGKYKKTQEDKEQRRAASMARHDGGPKVSYVKPKATTGTKATAVKRVTKPMRPGSNTSKNGGTRSGVDGPTNNIVSFNPLSNVPGLDLFFPKPAAASDVIPTSAKVYTEPTLPKDIKNVDVDVTSRSLESKTQEEKEEIENKQWYEGLFEGLAAMGRNMTNTINKAAEYVGDLIGDAWNFVTGGGADATFADGKFSGSMAPLFNLIHKYESPGAGFDALNPSTTGTAVYGKPLTETTIGEIMDRSPRGGGRASGMFQFMPWINGKEGTLYSAMKAAGYTRDTVFTAEVQTNMAIKFLPKHRPELWAYLTGKSDNINAAMDDFAREWAAFPNSRDTGAYSGQRSAGFEETKQALIETRKLVMASGSAEAGFQTGAARVGGVVKTNVKTIRDGGGTPYHIDMMFDRSTSWEQRVQVFDQLAAGYAAMGRRIEFSNSAVSGLVYRTNLTQKQKIDMLKRVESAHSNRKGGSGRAAMDFFVPQEGHARWTGGPATSGSGANVEYLLPVIEGGYYTVGAKGRSGQHIQAFDASGKKIYEFFHGGGGQQGRFNFSGAGSGGSMPQATQQNRPPHPLTRGEKKVTSGTTGKGQSGSVTHFKYEEYTGKRVSVGNNQTMAEPAAIAFKKMQEAAAKEGVTLQARSGFRSVKEQGEVFKRGLDRREGNVYENTLYIAPAGYSEHATGYAIDITGTLSEGLTAAVADTAAGKWLAANSAKFGYQMSFPKGNADGVTYEPWHFRFMGDYYEGSEPDTSTDGVYVPSEGGSITRQRPQRRKVTSWAERERRAQERIKSGQVRREVNIGTPAKNNGVRQGGAKVQTKAEELPKNIQTNDVPAMSNDRRGVSGSSGGSGGGGGAGGGSSVISGPVYTQGDLGSPGAFHFDIKRVEGGFYERDYLDNYVQVNGKPIGTGITVKGGEYGAPRSYGGHGGWDYAFGDKNAGLSLVNGARLISVTPTKTYGDKLIFQLPTGEQFAIIHGRATALGKDSAGAEGAYAQTDGSVSLASGGGGRGGYRYMQPPRRKVTSWAERERRAQERIRSGQVVRQSYVTNPSRTRNNQVRPGGNITQSGGGFGWLKLPSFFRPQSTNQDKVSAIYEPDAKRNARQKDLLKTIPSNQKDLDVDEILDTKVTQASDEAMSNAEIIGNVIAEAAAKAYKQKQEATPEKAVHHITNVQRPAETALNVNSYSRAITSNITRATKTQTVYQPDNDQNVILVSSQVDHTMVNVNVANSGIKSPCGWQMAGKKQRVQGPCVA
jgi:D-alanyl-D-alanine carboxypeptidase